MATSLIVAMLIPLRHEPWLRQIVISDMEGADRPLPRGAHTMGFVSKVNKVGRISSMYAESLFQVGSNAVTPLHVFQRGVVGDTEALTC